MMPRFVISIFILLGVNVAAHFGAGQNNYVAIKGGFQHFGNQAAGSKGFLFGDNSQTNSASKGFDKFSGFGNHELRGSRSSGNEENKDHKQWTGNSYPTFDRHTDNSKSSRDKGFTHTFGNRDTRFEEKGQFNFGKGGDLSHRNGAFSKGDHSSFGKGEDRSSNENKGKEFSGAKSNFGIWNKGFGDKGQFGIWKGFGIDNVENGAEKAQLDKYDKGERSSGSKQNWLEGHSGSDRSKGETVHFKWGTKGSSDKSNSGFKDKEHSSKSSGDKSTSSGKSLVSGTYVPLEPDINLKSGRAFGSKSNGDTKSQSKDTSNSRSSESYKSHGDDRNKTHSHDNLKSHHHGLSDSTHHSKDHSHSHSKDSTETINTEIYKLSSENNADTSKEIDIEKVKSSSKDMFPYKNFKSSHHGSKGQTPPFGKPDWFKTPNDREKSWNGKPDKENSAFGKSDDAGNLKNDKSYNNENPSHEKPDDNSKLSSDIKGRNSAKQSESKHSDSDDDGDDKSNNKQNPALNSSRKESGNADKLERPEKSTQGNFSSPPKKGNFNLTIF